MKKIFYTLLAVLFTAVGCQKSNDGEVAPTEEAVSFSAGMLTRSADMKNSWEVGDKVAIFPCEVSDGEFGTPQWTAVPLVYTVIDESGTLSAVNDCYYVEENVGYMAFYPYMEAASMLSYYNKTTAHFGDEDVLGAKAILADGETEASLQFDHVYARLDLTFTYDTSFEELEATIILDDNQVTLSYSGEYTTSAQFSVFVASGVIPSSAMIIIEIDGDDKMPIYLNDYKFYEDEDGNNGWYYGVNYQCTFEVEDLPFS